MRNAIFLAVLSLMVTAGCSTESTQGAAQGAASGAVAGAIGGTISALVFGGDVADAAARGAVWGGSTGAVAGGIQGAHRAERNQEAAAREEARQRERLRREIGDDAYRGLEALAECKHTVAIAYAERAQEDSDIEYMLAGYWLEIMTVAETDGEAAAGKLLPILVARDPKLTSTEQAATLVGEAMEELRDIRAQYGMAVSCA